MECFTSTSFLYHLILAGGLLHLELHVRLTGLPIRGSFSSVSHASDKTLGGTEINKNLDTIFQDLNPTKVKFLAVDNFSYKKRYIFIILWLFRMT